ncbi:MAG: transporter substrate-binding domain-containing protein [Rhodoferax sp.]|nr:MAG: transporter substrate-binding domain-containing protein [Rhodoferax sp.]
MASQSSGALGAPVARWYKRAMWPVRASRRFLPLLAFGLAVWLTLGAGPVRAQTVRLAAPEYPPYTSEVNGEAVGIAVDLVEKIMRQAGLRMEAHVVPNYSRCVFEVSHQIADGFFLGSRNSERDAVAVMTAPVMINRWIWVVRGGSAVNPETSAFKQHGSVGVLLNTNPHVWLKSKGYTITGTPTSGVSLLAMLDAGRFDAALVPELVFQHFVQQTGRAASQYRSSLHSSQDFGIYLAKDYLRAHPGLLERINAAIAVVTSEAARGSGKKTVPAKP